jgi:hypothetical protein
MIALYYCPNPATDPDLLKNTRPSMTAHDIPHYWVDILCASMLALNMGAKESVIYFIDSYIDSSTLLISSTVAYMLLVTSLAIGYWIFAYYSATSRTTP